MSYRGRRARSRKNGVIASTATFLAVVVAGCGGAQSPPAVQLALTAPTEGAEVTATHIKVFGTVDPANATVLVAGKRARVEHGAFARSMALHKGFSHIKIEARAAGYTSANLTVAVDSSPPARHRPAPTNAAPSESEALTSTANPTPPPAGSHYSPAVQAAFLRTCEAAAGGASATDACECALSHVEAAVSESTLRATELAVLRGEATLPQWMRDAGVACRKT
jgi:hypothetical protein